jgi:hypothetical protein
MTMGSEDALLATHAFPDSTLVAVHNEGWGICAKVKTNSPMRSPNSIWRTA